MQVYVILKSILKRIAQLRMWTKYCIAYVWLILVGWR